MSIGHNMCCTANGFRLVQQQTTLRFMLFVYSTNTSAHCFVKYIELLIVWDPHYIGVYIVEYDTGQ